MAQRHWRLRALLVIHNLVCPDQDECDKKADRTRLIRVIRSEVVTIAPTDEYSIQRPMPVTVVSFSRVGAKAAGLTAWMVRYDRL